MCDEQNSRGQEGEEKVGTEGRRGEWEKLIKAGYRDDTDLLKEMKSTPDCLQWTRYNGCCIFAAYCPLENAISKYINNLLFKSHWKGLFVYIKLAAYLCRQVF